jgi:exopolysaccharide biosynthesis operon protein EpsL
MRISRTRERFDVGVRKRNRPHPHQNAFLPTAIALACLGLLGVATSARADETDGFDVQTRVNMTHDDNLFLLPNPSVIPPGAPNTGSTWMETETADLSFNRIYGLQAVQADVNANHYTFDSLRYLDYDAVNYNAMWQWQLGSRLSGQLGVDHEKTLDSYDDFQHYSTPNLSIHTGETFKFDWDAVDQWHVVGGVLHANIESPSIFTQVGSFAQTDFQLGGSYVTGQGNSVTFQVRDSIGTFSRALDYVDVLDNGYKQREAETLTHWSIGAWTTLDTRIGYVDRRYDNFGQRDYRGWVGQIALNWQTSAYTSFKAAVSRNVVAFQADDSNDYWLEMFSAGPIWNITEKLKLSATGSISWRTFEGGIDGDTNVGSRSDRMYAARVELDYKPTRYSSIGLFATLSQQNSNVVETAYSDRTVGITASLAF